MRVGVLDRLVVAHLQAAGLPAHSPDSIDTAVTHLGADFVFIRPGLRSHASCSPDAPRSPPEGETGAVRAGVEEPIL